MDSLVQNMAAVTLGDLWLPLVLSAVAVFVVSSIIHMATPMHKTDWKPLPGEGAILDAMRAQNLPAGEYMFPAAATMKEMCSPEMVAKQKRGPVGVMTLRRPGAITMGPPLIQWFIYCLVISLFVAYLATLGLSLASSTKYVFRFTAAAAVMAYATNSAVNSIWKSVSWGITFKFVIDGILYGLATGAVFAWMWPEP